MQSKTTYSVSVHTIHNFNTFTGVLDTLSMDEMAELSLSGSVSSPCVPTVVMMCIRHLEQFGLHTVGIFRVSSSKKRVKQVIKSIQ